MSTLHAPPGQEPPTQSPTAATRHLCAGVYTDEKFRDLVINEVCLNPSRRVAPSYGFDLVPVMRHAWWAAHLSASVRLALLASVAAPLLLGHFVAGAMAMCGFGLLLLADRAIALSRELTEEDEPDLFSKKRKNKRRRVAKPTLIRTRHEVKDQLKKTGIRAAALSGAVCVLAVWSPSQAVLAGALFGSVAVVAVVAGSIRQARINQVHKEEQDLRPPRLSFREAVVSDQQDHPCVIYRRPEHKGEDDEESAVFTLFGEDSPFIGAGELVHQWNPPMSIQLLRPDTDSLPLHQREHRKPPFATHELVEHLRGAVTELRSDEESVRLPVEVRDRIYVAEADVSVDRSLLAERPDRCAMRRVIDQQSPVRQHFLEVSVPEAGAELVATVFLQVGVRGRTLSLTFAACALTRTPDSFRRAEEFGQKGKRAVAASGISSLFFLSRELTRLPHIVKYFYSLCTSVWFFRRERTLTPIRNVPIGSRLSVRQDRAQEWSKVQFDKTHLLGHMKNIEQRLLKATSDFLQSRGVDISEFDDRATQIINSGIVNLGGTNDFTNTAFGDHAQFQNNTQQPGGNQQNGNAA
ncbi:hypothetical protein [Nocardiopsis salina]|uniref:hypothetical protein n=1 Tax=Nocardiopsis salina TaxID=245836 RepID=UPI00034B1034|nr:hypothetical protein [Nocardiopsis salina]